MASCGDCNGPALAGAAIIGEGKSHVFPAVTVFTAALGLLPSGCASIVEGTTQEISINTNPPGAACDLWRQGATITRVDPTPGGTLIKKTEDDIRIECSLEGYQKASYLNKSDADPATFGNIILGGGIGWAIDSASGADNKYTSPVNITLIPENSKQDAIKRPAASVRPGASHFGLAGKIPLVHGTPDSLMDNVRGWQLRDGTNSRVNSCNYTMFRRKYHHDDE